MRRYRMEIRKSVCPYDCPDCCGLLIEMENGRAVKVAGDPDHPFTRGTLCPKMAHYERTVYSPLRILTPLRRTGKKGEGRFMPISWEEAISFITDQWKNIIRTNGAESILPYSYAGSMGTIQYSAGHAFFYDLGAASLERTICAPAKACGYQDVMGQTLPTDPQEAQKSDCIILWSISMLATNIHFKHDIDIARAHGAKVYCIDTYRTRTADYADHFIRIRPGTDGALALGMMHVIRRDGLADNAFIAQHVQGWERLCDKILPHYTLGKTADITGVSAATIEELAHAYATAHAPFIRLGSGQSRYGNGAMTSRLITCLPASVGAYAKPGGGLLTSASGSHALDKSIIRRPDKEKPGIRHINMCELGRVLNQKDPASLIKSLYVYSSNPACTAPDQMQVLRGLAREDLLTVVHERFLTDTARYADIVLPATTSLEHSDLYYSYGQYVLERSAAVIAPIGESKSNWQVFSLLAKAMNLPDSFYNQTEEELITALIESTGRFWPLPIDKKKLSAGIPVPLPLPPDYKLDFRTPSGKIEIENPRCQPSLPDYFPPHMNQDPESFSFVNSPDARILDSSFNERNDLLRRHTMELMMHPSDARRLQFIDGQQVQASNAQGRATFTLRITDRTAPGVLVSEGVWWKKHTADGNTNRLTTMRLTDQGGGSTFYDVRINIESAEKQRQKTAEKNTIL